MNRARIEKGIRIDLGDEPPLDISADDSPNFRRGGLSLRWFASAMITGVAGLGLFSAALYSSVNGNLRFAQPLPGWEGRTGDDLAASDNERSGVKGDKFVPSQEVEVQRHVIQSTAVTRMGNKEFIRIRPYMRLVAPLELTSSGVSADLPDFNPLRIYSTAGIFSDEPEAEAEDTEEADVPQLTTRVSDFALADVDVDETTVLSDAEALEAIRAVAPFGTGNALAFRPQIAPTAYATPGDGSLSDGALAAAGLGVPEIWSGIGVEPANTTMIAKTSTEPENAAFKPDAVQTRIVDSGDTLASILGGTGVAPSEAKAIAESFGDDFDPRHLKPGDEIRVAMMRPQGDTDPDVNLADMVLDRVSIFDGTKHLVTAARIPAGGFTSLSDPSSAVPQSAIVSVPQPSAGRLNIYRSLYETGHKHGIPEEILSKMVRVHAYDVDFKRSVQPGDAIEIFFEMPEAGREQSEEDTKPLMISMTIRGQTAQFYRFRTPDDGVIDYYDPEGRSAKKFLIRKPMNGGRFRSGFGMRRHPILGYRKMHQGVDWAAPRGTPILAAGNGKVVKAGRKGGYGNYVRLRHANGYETAYAHMNGFASGIEEGVQVSQGQVIGYVGSTGLSTGPHLHYEVLVNGNYVDPLRIRLPRGRTLQGEILLAFEKERARIDTLMNSDPMVSASVETPQWDASAPSFGAIGAAHAGVIDTRFAEQR
ncbi:MAG: M23 family metallopeptidase [Hyphomicrobiales bacterium]|nr:M23 family metallopeptidase [Hyphomicrobiales bacterium]